MTSDEKLNMFRKYLQRRRSHVKMLLRWPNQLIKIRSPSELSVLDVMSLMTLYTILTCLSSLVAERHHFISL